MGETELIDKSVSRQLEKWRDFSDRKFEESHSYRRWSYASLLAICGGGIVAILNTQDLNQSVKFYSFLWFSIGMVSTLISGFAQAGAQTAQAKVANNLVDELGSVSTLSDLDDALESAKAEAKNSLQILLPLAVSASLLAIFSVAIAGAIMIRALA